MQSSSSTIWHIFNLHSSTWKILSPSHLHFSIKDIIIIAPMITQVVTHILIIKAMRANGRRLGDAQQQRAQKPNLRVMKTISITLGLYYACWFPLIVQMIWNSVKQSPEWFDAVTVHTLVANSGLSFVIYTSSLPTFQQQVKKTLLKCLAGGYRVASQKSSCSN